QKQQQQQLHQPPRQTPLPEIPQHQPTPPPPPQQQPQPSNRVDFTSLDDLERRVAELRGFTAVQPPAASSRYPGGAAPTANGLADGSKDPVSRLEQLEAEYENLRKMLLRQNAQQQQQPQPQKPHQPPASSTRLEASSFATSTSSASSAAVATVGGAIDTRRPDTASQRERKRQAYKAELERQLAEQKQQKQRPSLQEQSATRPGIGDLSSLQSSKPSPPAGYLGLDLDDGGGGGLGSYGLGIYEGLTPRSKGGGGAPIKDAQGNTRANLKQVMRETDDDRLSNSGHRAAATGDGYDDFRGRGGDFSSGVAPAGSADPDDWMQHLDGLKDLQTRLSKSFTDDFGGFSNATAANATNSRQQKDVQQQEKQQQQQPQHARGGHGIFGRGLSDEQKRQRERYQEELRQQ
uniref:Thyroid hormone receptor-associated protein complex subunit n=1 Tax=Macrostomum lignano TaxID=282301 RepID=A0A1I8JAV3_9PLAT